MHNGGRQQNISVQAQTKLREEGAGPRRWREGGQNEGEAGTGQSRRWLGKAGVVVTPWWLGPMPMDDGDREIEENQSVG